MIRKIITIDREKCNGCGLCVSACHEGAIGLVEGKARLLREDYCDGLGDCLPACPMNAISFEEREAAAYDAAAVAKAQRKTKPLDPEGSLGQLQNFPVQLKLAPVNAPWFQDARLLIAADCTAFACGDFHERFLKGRVALVGCPKLDGVNYAEKLSRIFTENNIQDITVVRMTVPCCGGLPFAVKTALEACGKDIPLQIVTLTPQGAIV
jgi:NAD-dependent dihydropyrimidine dehydrogenase PreA subunit